MMLWRRLRAAIFEAGAHERKRGKIDGGMFSSLGIV